MLITAKEGSVKPDYSQFYVRTETGEHASDQVTDDGYEIHLEAPNSGFVYVGTLKQYFTTPVRVEVHDMEPPEPDDEWQHVVEVSLEGDGKLHVLSWPGDEVAVSVPTPAVSLRLRALWGGLDLDLSASENSPEHLLFQVWPAPTSPRRVIRWWPPWELAPRSSTAADGRRQIQGVDDVVAHISAGLRLIPVDFGTLNERPPLPGGGSGYAVAIYGDPRDGQWWIDGYDVRHAANVPEAVDLTRTLRTVTEDEVRELLKHTRPTIFTNVRYLPNDRWTAMLARVGLAP